MLCIRPDLMRRGKAEPGHVEEFGPALAKRIFDHGFAAVTPNGVLGDPTGMSAEIGERCIAVTADGVAAALRQKDAGDKRRSTRGKSQASGGDWPACT